MLLDHSLEVSGNLPAAGQTSQLGGSAGVLDIGVSQPGFSNQWRHGRLRITYPALPNHTNPALNITVVIYDSADGGGSFQQVAPLTEFSIPGVASTGVPAGYQEIAFPPGLRGPMAFYATVPAGVGDCTGALVCINFNIE